MQKTQKIYIIYFYTTKAKPVDVNSMLIQHQCYVSYQMSHHNSSNRFLKMFRDVASTKSAGRLFQSFATLCEKERDLISFTACSLKTIRGWPLVCGALIGDFEHLYYITSPASINQGW